jgi:hypothetical protein
MSRSCIINVLHLQTGLKVVFEPKELFGKVTNPSSTPSRASHPNVLALRVGSIAEVAHLALSAYGTGLRPRREADTAPPVTGTAEAGVGQRPALERALGAPGRRATSARLASSQARRRAS